MNTKLNGWQRLWALLSLTSLIPFGIWGALQLPSYSNIKESVRIERSLSEEAKNQIAITGQPVGIKVKMPDGHIIKLKPNIEAKKSTIALNEYMSKLDIIRNQRRTFFTLQILSAWALCCALFYVIGVGIAWVRRGFSVNDV